MISEDKDSATGSEDRFPDQKTITEMYHAFRADFLHFGRRYLANEEDVLDAYQDSMIILFEHMQAGKLKTITSSVKTYLFAIGKHVMMAAFRKGQRTILPGETPEPEDFAGVTDVEHEIMLSERQQFLAQALTQLDEKCRRILTLFYYRQYDQESIAETLGYKSGNVVKSHKARCMERLRKIISPNKP